MPDHIETRAVAATGRECDDVIAWRRAQLLRAGFSQQIATRVAHDGRYDLHRLIELVENGCPHDLALEILAPLDGDEAA
jgi:hypothetical protein